MIHCEWLKNQYLKNAVETVFTNHDATMNYEIDI